MAPNIADQLAQSSSSTAQLKVFFHALDETGHINACIGLAQTLAKRGHRIYFIQNDSFAGQFVKLGFGEILLKTTSDETNELATKDNNPVKKQAKQRLKAGLFGPGTPLEKIKRQVTQPRENRIGSQMVHKVMAYNSLIERAIERERPDLIILDTFMVLPAIWVANIPWILLFSANPLLLYQSEKLPPFGSGYATTSDPENWKEYTELMKVGRGRFSQAKNHIYAKFNIELSEEEKTSKQLIDLSPYLNIYGYPKELDYDDIVPRPSNLAQLDSFCREISKSENVFEIPEALNLQHGDKLIYFSLGSMGSVDVDLMKRILSVLEQTPYKYIVSKGQCGDEYELPQNCWGENFLPQTSILPLVDLVITHGGNNTITESLLHGKPMIVMPLFTDQPDNAQRVHEKGYGVRVEPYNFTESELIETINRALNDSQMASRAKAVAERMAKSNSKDKVVDQLEQIVAEFRKHQQNV